MRPQENVHFRGALQDGALTGADALCRAELPLDRVQPPRLFMGQDARRLLCKGETDSAIGDLGRMLQHKTARSAAVAGTDSNQGLLRHAGSISAARQGHDRPAGPSAQQGSGGARFHADLPSRCRRRGNPPADRGDQPGSFQRVAVVSGWPDIWRRHWPEAEAVADSDVIGFTGRRL